MKQILVFTPPPTQPHSLFRNQHLYLLAVYLTQADIEPETSLRERGRLREGMGREKKTTVTQADYTEKR